MRQLTGLDSSFLYMETPNAPMHISGLGIYDPSTAPGGEVRFKEIIENINSRLGLANRMNPSFNCVITNVPGPPIPLYHTGAKMVATYGTGPVQDGVGLFIAIGSYCGDFVISASSCREMMPDPAFYRECLQASYNELFSAAGESTT